MKDIKYESLVQQALQAREKSYSPYSKFKVGAALLGLSGKVYLGANIESAAYSPTNCAERTAFFQAVFEGERSFDAIAVCGSFSEDTADYCYPCGVCRQVMLEFCNPQEFKVIVVKNKEEYKIYLLDELIPHGFGAGNLNES